MDETAEQNKPVREPQRELIIFLAVSVAFVALGILIGALTGSEPAVPAPGATPTAVISAGEP